MQRIGSESSSSDRGRAGRAWEYPKGSGIKIAEIPNKTAGRNYGVSYQVRVPAKLLGIPGRREIHQRSSKADAERLAEDRLLALRRHGTEFARIPASAQREAAMAWSILDDHNRTTRLDLKLLDVVKAGIAVLSPPGGLRTFTQVAAELRSSKAARHAAGTLDISTERSFRKRSELLERTPIGNKLVSEIVVADVSSVLTDLVKKYSARSVLNFRNVMAEILRFAEAKQYAPRNPMDGLTREELKRLGGQNAERKDDSINILSVEEAKRLLDAAASVLKEEPGMLPTLVLRLFCGLRTGEVSRLNWDEVRWREPRPYVHIPAGKAKKRRIRQVKIPSNALAWLRLCNPPPAGPLDPYSHKTYAKRFGRIAKLAGIGRSKDGIWISDWETNDTRHSFGSYHYALHGNAIRTARELGHKQNDDVLFAHYRQLVSNQSAKAYFSLTPLIS